MFDGGDCIRSPYVLCPGYSNIGDGICNDGNNIEVCMYDGGDCCLRDLDKSQCTDCNCITEDDFDPCPEAERIDDGNCDQMNNNTICSYDGGDCAKYDIENVRWISRSELLFENISENICNVNLGLIYIKALSQHPTIPMNMETELIVCGI